MENVIHSHCSYCGTKYAFDVWPRRCAACGNMTWRNPTPVGIAVVPCGLGILGVRRGIEPKKGELALPGGFIDFGESWQKGVARELEEELGIAFAPEAVDFFAIHSVPSGRQVLIFGLLPRISPADLKPFVPNDEVTERVILTGDEELCFPLHTQVMRQYYSRRRDL